MAYRGGSQRTSAGRRHPRVSVPELSPPRGRQRRPHAHRPLGRPNAIDPAGRRRVGSPPVAVAGGRERIRSLPRRHRGDRRRRNADPAALRRPRGRRVTDPERSGPRRYRLSDPCGHGHDWHGRFDDSGREPDPDCADRHSAATTRTATDRPSASVRGGHTSDSHTDTGADAQPDGHTDRESVGSDQRVTLAQREPDARAHADTQSEPIMRNRVRAVSERCVDATLLRLMRSWSAQQGIAPMARLS